MNDKDKRLTIQEQYDAAYRRYYIETAKGLIFLAIAIAIVFAIARFIG